MLKEIAWRRLEGNVTLVTDNRDAARYSFEAIGIYNPDGTFEGRGAAVFDDGTTGELSSLSNTVAIHKDRIGNSGNGTFLIWHWKKTFACIRYKIKGLNIISQLVLFDLLGVCSLFTLIIIVQTQN